MKTIASLFTLTSLLALSLSLGNTLYAAEEPDADSSTITYPAAYFAQFGAVSVNDMLNRIPGIGLALESNQNQRPGANNDNNNNNNRGLGDSDQILINGKRMAGKANEAASQLTRISADQVDYIEIIRGTSGDLDVRNAGQIVNIILLQTLPSYSVSGNLGATLFQDDKIKPVGSLSLSGQAGRLSYLVSGEVKSNYENMHSFEISLHPDLAINETIEFDRLQDQSTYTLNSNLVFNATESDRFAINLLYNESDPPAKLLRTLTDFNSTPNRIDLERETLPATADNWEFGGDYEHGFSGGERFKFLFIVNSRNNAITRERFLSSPPDYAESNNLFLDTDSRYQERIARSSYTWSPANSHTLELGLEGAQTIQDSALRLGQRIPGTASPEYGGLVPVSVPNAISTVEEIRYEGFLVHNWSINEKISLESALLSEHSEIEQTGDVQNKRSFNFLKPKFDLRYNMSRSLQVRASIERFVSQLSFADFSAATNNRDDDQDTVAGNPQLEQELIWRYNLNLDYRLPNDGGVLNTRLFYFDVDNSIGKIDISPRGGRVLSTNGNVGRGTVIGLNVDSSIRLKFLNLPDAVLTAGFLVQDSYIDDPVSGLERKVVPYDRGNVRLGFRHDVTGRNLSYGLNYRDGIDGSRTLYDIDNVLYIGSNSDLTLFVEKQGRNGFAYRLEGNNLMDHESCRTRFRYNGYLRDAMLREIERSCTTVGPRVTFSIRGTL